LSNDAFAVSIRLPVFWGDMDALGHVNNVCYLRWFEQARIAYFEAIGLVSDGRSAVGPILATTTCDFLSPVTYPADVVVGASVDRTGRTSFVMRYGVSLASAPEKLVAKGSAVVVTVDYGRGEKVPLSEALLASIASVEARS
jgi:acyl-CoA thioester hydrolase